jgi:hypothetical protein
VLGLRLQVQIRQYPCTQVFWERVR